MLMEMRTSNDAEFSELLGVEYGWTEFLYSMLLAKRWRGGGIVDDLFTEIVNSLLLNLHGGGQLARFAEEIKANTVGDDAARLDGMQRLMNRALRLRFRDYIRETRFNIGRHGMSDEDGGNWFESVIADNHFPEHDIEMADLAEAIQGELAQRASTASGFARTVLQLALKFYPDRCMGLGIRDLCNKHNIPKGRKAGLALKEIISAAEVVVNRVGMVVP